MIGPRGVVAGTRIVLGLAAVCLAVLMLAPAFQGAERYFALTDSQAHAIAFYGLTLFSLLAAPRVRRNDLALAMVAIGAAMELAQSVTGRSASFSDLAADSIGVFVAWAPTQVERVRRLARMHPYLSFAEIRAMDRRRRSPIAITIAGETAEKAG
ncbi:MAG: VanZ family protein [Caulobacteraceae bacterium]